MHKIGKTAVSLDKKRRKTVVQALRELIASSDSEDLNDETYKFLDLESESKEQRFPNCGPRTPGGP